MHSFKELHWMPINRIVVKNVVNTIMCLFWIYMVRSIESATAHSYKELHCRSFFGDFGEEKKKKNKEKKRQEHWVWNWEQWDWSPLGGWIPSVHIVLFED